jgi:hypothetical protein
MNRQNISYIRSQSTAKYSVNCSVFICITGNRGARGHSLACFPPPPLKLTPIVYDEHLSRVNLAINSA